MQNKEMLEKLAASFGSALKIEADNFYDILVVKTKTIYELAKF